MHSAFVSHIVSPGPQPPMMHASAAGGNSSGGGGPPNNAECRYGIVSGSALMAAAAAITNPWLASATQMAPSSPPTTSADLDDAIMETVEDDLFDATAATASASSLARLLSSPAIPSLAPAGLDRLPDRPRSACNVIAAASGAPGGGAAATTAAGGGIGGAGSGCGPPALPRIGNAVAVNLLSLQQLPVPCGSLQVPISPSPAARQQQMHPYPTFGSNPHHGGNHDPTQPLPHQPCCLSGSGTYTCAIASAGYSSSTSTVHPALAQVLAAGGADGSAAAAFARHGRSPAAPPPSPPSTSLNLPLVSRGAGPTAADAFSAAVAREWGLGGPIGPVPVPVSAVQHSVQFPSSSQNWTNEGSQHSNYHPSSVAGSIAAAAAVRSLNASGNAGASITNNASANGVTSSYSQPASFIAPIGGPTSIASAANSSNRHPLVYSDPWIGSEGGPNPGFGGYGRGDKLSAFMAPLAQLLDVLPDSSSNKYVASVSTVEAAAAAAAGNGDSAVVAAAVRAMLRSDSDVSPFVLSPRHCAAQPGQQRLQQQQQLLEESQQEPQQLVVALPGCDSAPLVSSAASRLAASAGVAAAASASAVKGVDVAAAGTFAPELPPPGPLPTIPLPASIIESLQPSGVAAVDRYLQQLLMDPSTDRHVFLCKRPLSVVACGAVASCLRVCPGIKSITLSYCGITCEGLAALCDGLRTCRDLLVLDLSYNIIGDMGAAALAASLADMPSLASLSLAGNSELADAGAAALAAAARGCSTLRRIGLRGTAVTPPGLRELSGVLGGKTRRTSAARRASVAAGGGGGSPIAGGGGGAAGGAERPVSWDGMLGSGGGGSAAAADGVFIAQLCSLLRTLVQPALAAELAVAEAVAELMATAPTAAAGEPKDSGTAGTSSLLSYLADGLARRGYDVAVTHALGGGSGGACLRNLRHTFLSVTCPMPAVSGPPSPAAAAVSLACSTGSSSCRHPAGGGADIGSAVATSLPYHPGIIIVDPELREQFEVAMPTPRYEALVSALPQVYVGAEERLPLVVEVLCDEMALSLRSKGMVIPPWRESAAMISKWQPKQSKMLVPGASSGASAAAVPAASGGLGLGGSAAAETAAATTAAAASMAAAASVGSSGSVAPRVSLAGGMAAAVPVQWCHGYGATAAGSDGRAGSDAPSVGSVSVAGSSRPESVQLVTSFGFRRCTTTDGLSGSAGGSVSMAAPLTGYGMTPMAAAIAAAVAAASGGGGGCGGLSFRLGSSSGLIPRRGLSEFDHPRAAVDAAAAATGGGAIAGHPAAADCGDAAAVAVMAAPLALAAGARMRS